jgi:DNA-binding FrmR family transcriptional regulator
MNANDQKKLVGRLRRVAGQIRALEQQLDAEPEVVTNQFLAAIAAMKSTVRFYLEKRVLERESLSSTDRQLLARLINRVD